MAEAPTADITTVPGVRSPSEVPVTRVGPTELDEFAAELRRARRVAIDTETVFVEGGIGPMRVLSAATRAPDGTERAWVVDSSDFAPGELAPVLQGVTAEAWNADFDARVVDTAVFEPAGYRVTSTPGSGINWWDAQLADALLHQGLTGFSFYHGLAWATRRYLGFDAAGKGSTQLSFSAREQLSEEQILYAGADAVETLWVSDEIRRLVTEAELDEVCELEQRARPFLDHMERRGLPFDWSGWSSRLREMENRLVAVRTRLAELTGGGQATLFSPELEPSWNPASETQAKEILNRFATERVRSWFRDRTGYERLFDRADSLRHETLVGLGGPLAEALIEFRDLTKTLSTYGSGIEEFMDPDGRMRPEYLQVVGTNTGRLASRRPNAQNFTPRMKPFIRPSEPDRVLVHSDLSQAELRMVAQISGDTALRRAFDRDQDVHSTTAEAMFGVDMAELARSDPDLCAEYRAKAKRINFGIVYGQRGRGLAMSLTQSGVETTTEEGQKLLEAYLAAYPGVARWTRERDDFIEALARDPGPVDWVATLDLHALWGRMRGLRRAFRHTHRRWPTASEIADELAMEPGEVPGVDLIEWALGFEAPVVLTSSGEPFRFCSRTVARRRQQFTISTDRVLLGAVLRGIESDLPALAANRARFGRTHEVDIGDSAGPAPRPHLEKVMENRSLRRSYAEEVARIAGQSVLEDFLDSSLRASIRMMANAYRNAPVQGGVADAMLAAYALIHEALESFDEAFGIQTVHDSVVVECRADQAVEIARAVKAAMEAGLSRFCPDVAVRADTDIRRSLDPADIISTVH